MNYKAHFEPRPHEFCLCGSGLAFRICCHGKYKSVTPHVIEGHLKAGEAAIALELARRFLTWYRVSHLAHTAPLVPHGNSIILDLLKTDIEALEEITELLLRCLVAAGAQENSTDVFTSIESSVDDPRWREAVFTLRVQFNWRYLSDEATWEVLSKSPQFATATRVEVFMAWLSTNPEGTPVAQRLAVIARLRKCSSRADVQMLCDLVDGGLRICDPADATGTEILKRGVARFRTVPAEARTSFGVLKFSQALNVLGHLTASSALLEESIAESQRYLRMSSVSPDKFSGTVLCECGEACLGLGDPGRAIPFLESALAENPSAPLPMIYLAKAHLRLKSITEVRRWLSRATPLLQTEANKLDFAYVTAQLALHTKALTDIDSARNHLANCRSGIGIFEKIRIDYLNDLADIEITPSTAEPKSFLTRLFTRYLMLEPNVAGIGVRVNAVIEDGVAAHKRVPK